MSNKIQLQTNNTNLDALITRVNTAKNTAASLPDAGSGGASIDTCTVTINKNSSTTPAYLSYTDENAIIHNDENTGATTSITINVIKNTMLVINSTNMMVSFYGSAESVNSPEEYWYTFFIKGDVNFNVGSATNPA